MNISDKFNLYRDSFIKSLDFININFNDFYENDTDINREIIRILLGVDIQKSYPYIKNLDTLKDLFNNYDININNFYYQSYMGFVRVFYVYNGFIMDIAMSESIIAIVSNIKDMQIDFDEYFFEGEDLPPFLFIRATNLFRPQMIEFIAEYMKEEDLISEVKEFQKSSDYNSHNFSLDIIKRVYEDTIDIIDNFLINGYLEVYRGVGSKSKKLNEAYSWTLNEDVAKFFATRAIGMEQDINNIKVYKAIVPKKVILGVIVDTEEEVLINPELIKHCSISEIDFDKSIHHQMPKVRKYLTDDYLPKEKIEEFIEEDDEDDGEIKISPLLLGLLDKN